MQIRLRTTGGFKRGFKRNLPSFEHVHFGFWRKFCARVDPDLRSRAFKLSFSQIATEIRAARIGWWWMGRSRHLVQVSIPLAETVNLVTPWTEALDALPVLMAWCQKHGLQVVEQSDDAVVFSDNRAKHTCRGTVTFLPTEVQLRFWSRSGPRLAAVVEGLGASLSEASVPAPKPPTTIPPWETVSVGNVG